MARAHGIVGISPDAVRALETYAWPGNVRELRNVIERVVALGDESSVGLADLPDAIQARGGLTRRGSRPRAPYRHQTAFVADNGHEDEEHRICEALRKHRNNRLRAADGTPHQPGDPVQEAAQVWAHVERTIPGE